MQIANEMTVMEDWEMSNAPSTESCVHCSCCGYNRHSLHNIAANGFSEGGSQNMLPGCLRSCLIVLAEDAYQIVLQ